LNTVVMPSAAQLPKLPSDWQSSPKSILHNAFQGVLRFEALFTTTSERYERCTLSTVLEDGTDISAVGDGKSKVCLEPMFSHQILTSYRNKPKGQLTCI
jgi:hypothetical protein